MQGVGWKEAPDVPSLWQWSVVRSQELGEFGERCKCSTNHGKEMTT